MKKLLSIALAAALAVACQPRAERRAGTEGQQQEGIGQEERTEGQAGQRFTEIGTVASAEENSLTLRRPTGEEVKLDLRDTTSITMDGRFIQVEAVPEGAEVRASYTQDGNDRVAQSIEVLRAEGQPGQQQPGQQQPGQMQPGQEDQQHQMREGGQRDIGQEPQHR